MDKETKDILSINKIKRDAQKKRMGINRKPGESLAAFVTRAKKHKEKMQKEETEEDRIQKHADRINKEKSQGLSKTQHKKAMAAANRIHRQRSMAAKRNEEVELDEAVIQGSKEHLKKLQGMLDKVKPGSADHSQIRGAIESKFGKQHIPAKHRNVKPDMYEEVELDEADVNSIGQALMKKYGEGSKVVKKSGRYYIKYTKGNSEANIGPFNDLDDVMKRLKEEVELDESKNLMKDYQELKSQGKKDSTALDILMSMPKYKSMSKDKMRKAIGDARRKGIFKEEVNLQEDAWEEIPMMKRQLRYIQVASRDIMEYISQCDDQCVDPEEWFQNKLSHIHGQMQSLHAYVEGEHDREDPEYDMEESYDIYEKLEVSDGIEAWIKDFYKSDAPQFKGKDKKERRDMAVAAYLSAKRKKEG